MPINGTFEKTLYLTRKKPSPSFDFESGVAFKFYLYTDTGFADTFTFAFRVGIEDGETPPKEIKMRVELSVDNSEMGGD